MSLQKAEGKMRLYMLFVLMFIAVASGSCGYNKKEEPKIHVIRVKSSNKLLDGPDIVELHFPLDILNRRRREFKVKTPNLICKTNTDCPSNNMCDEKLDQCLPQNREKEQYQVQASAAKNLNL